MLVNEPTHESTLLNSLGRSQATVQAQMPPLLIPAMARPAASWRSFTVFSTSGRISSRRNRAYWSDRVSYSKLRFDLARLEGARLDEDADCDRHLVPWRSGCRRPLGRSPCSRHRPERPSRRPGCRPCTGTGRRPTSHGSCRRRSCSPRASAGSACPWARRSAGAVGMLGVDLQLSGTPLRGRPVDALAIDLVGPSHAEAVGERKGRRVHVGLANPDQGLGERAVFRGDHGSGRRVRHLDCPGDLKAVDLGGGPLLQLVRTAEPGADRPGKLLSILSLWSAASLVLSPLGVSFPSSVSAANPTAVETSMTRPTPNPGNRRRILIAGSSPR